jgi:protein-S-isoprenylcysteine O-methyltransferase Ste14
VQRDLDTTTRIGGWLFRYRTSIPLPVALAILTLRVGEAPPSRALVLIGVAFTIAGELLRLWSVRYIGAISRTRSDRLGPLVSAGPFARVRNPLYVGNIAVWVGFAIAARLVWLAPVIVALLGLEYHAIVRWEERLLESRLGESYRHYAATVSRWWPRRRGRREGRERDDDGNASGSADSASSAFSLRETVFSERGTLIAIALGYLLLWLKARF